MSRWMVGCDGLAIRYEVDAAMLGDQWCGDATALRQFCAILQGIEKDVEIVAIVDSHNGANNEQPGLVSEVDWNRAIEESNCRWWKD